jgi:hypothetical protein
MAVVRPQGPQPTMRAGEWVGVGRDGGTGSMVEVAMVVVGLLGWTWQKSRPSGRDEDSGIVDGLRW